VYQSPLLTIRSVSVEGNSALLPEVVRNIAGVKGESLIRPDFAAAEDRLRAVSMIKDVKIERTFPMGARITIVERQPWGYWQAGLQRVVVDDEGVVIDLIPPQGATTIVQTDLAVKALELGDQVDPGAVAVAAQLATTAQQTLGRPLTSIEYSKNEGLTAVLDGGVRAVFGDAQGYDFKIATLSAILQQADAQGQTLHRVDLRFGDRVTTQ
jgi:cell division septal protein FtsQ